MAVATFKCEFPRRQAMLSIRELRPRKLDGTFHNERVVEDVEYVKTARIPVFVWPIPTQDGCFIVEHQDGRCQKVQPDLLTFLGSKEFFDQYDWSE